MNLLEQISSENSLDDKRGYWFIRTDSGLYFDTYTKKDFIGIGWNFITVEDLTKGGPSGYEVKVKIAKHLDYDLNIKKGKSKSSAVYNKLLRFMNLKKGDVVVIPSNSSSRLAFGIIEDKKVYVDVNESHGCNYHKRRKIKWLDIRDIKSLDPKFYQIIVSQHAISDIRKYDNYIDNITNSLYYKSGFGHFVFDIKTEDDVNVKTFINLVNSIQSLVERIDSHFELNEDISNSSIKLNLQSPGKIEYKLKRGKSLAILAAVLILTSCSNDNPSSVSGVNTDEIKQFATINKDSLKEIDKAINELKIDKERIKKIQ